MMLSARFLGNVSIVLMVLWMITIGGAATCDEKGMEYNWGPESNGLQLGVRLDKGTFVPGESVSVHLALRNVGNAKTAIIRSATEMIYDAVVDYERGAGLRPTEWGARMLRGRETPWFALSHVDLDPNGIVEDTYRLNYMYPMDRLGRYTIRMSFLGDDTFSKKPAASPVVANPVMLTVTAAGTPEMEAWSPMSHGLQLGARVTYTPLDQGAIVLQVAVRNAGDKPAVIGQTKPELDYDLVVTDREGKPVLLTAKGVAMMAEKKTGTPRSRSAVNVPPDLAVMDTYRVNDFYDMTKPGTYSIQVSSMLPGGDARSKAAPFMLTVGPVSGVTIPRHKP